jgi:hypothetical protein
LDALEGTPEEFGWFGTRIMALIVEAQCTFGGY